MIRPIDVEPLTRDTLVLLETDYPAQADAAPASLVQDPTEWTLVDKFCFFSGGPINTEEDVFYQADFDGNPIFMLAFLSPSLTPEELYRLTQDNTDEPGLKSVAAVEDVESVYDLTERDFDDLKLYHLGPCRALYVFFNRRFNFKCMSFLSILISFIAIIFSFPAHLTSCNHQHGPRSCHHTS